MILRNLILLSFFMLCFLSNSATIASELSCNVNHGQILSKEDEEFIKWIDSIPKDTASEDLCETVKVIKTEKVENQVMSFFGQGSIFKSIEEPGKLFVLTAAHVVANANKLEVQCGDKIIEVKIRGISQTKDLAVLELEEVIKGIKPLFTWSKVKLPIAEVRSSLPASDEDYIPIGAHYIQTSKDFVDKKDLHLVRITDQGMKSIPNRYSVETEIVTDPSHHPLVGSKTALLLTKEGVRPGMSGSPIIYSVQVLNPNAKNKNQTYIEKHYLAGVLLKTYINDTQSIAVPIETINETLPFLLAGKDPAKLEQSSYFFEKKLVTKDSRLVEVPTITFHTENGNEEFQSVCPSPFSNSSGKAGTGDSTGKSGTGDSTGKAGIGDSTGKAGTGDSTGKAGTGDSTGKAGTGDSTGSDEAIDNYKSDIYSLYRDHYSCKDVGIKDSKGNVYLAIVKEDGSVAKTESIEDISDLIQKYGNKFPEYIKGHGLKAKDTNEMYIRFCRNEDIFNKDGRPDKIKISRQDFDPKNLEVANYQTKVEVSNGEKNSNTKMEVSCSLANQSVKIQATNGNVTINLNISPRTWSGVINFQGCQTSFEVKTDSPWFMGHKDKNLDFQVSFSPEQSFLNFDILAANAKCLKEKKENSPISIKGKPNYPSVVWLSKIAISLSQKDKGQINKGVFQQDEQLLFDDDNKLNNEALRLVNTDPRKAKEILARLNQSKLSELEKERLGLPVSEQRIYRLRSMINLLKSKLGSD